jgi:hypothetical protein
MTENEIKLINIIRESDNPEEAIIIAAEVIIGYISSKLSPKTCDSIDGEESA